MVDRFYHVDLDNGFTDPNLSNIRKVAIDYLLSNPGLDHVDVYRSPTQKILYGTVELHGNASFQWRPKKGTLVRLNRDGTHGKHI